LESQIVISSWDWIRRAVPLALVLMLSSLSLPARSIAAEKAGWSGAGTMACGEVAGAIRQHPEDENLFFSWAQGFMSGLNTELLKHGETDLNGIPLDEQKQFVRSYCGRKPRAKYFEAVFKLYDKMRRDQGLPNYEQTWQEPKGR
jgi:hypothetical protein